MRTPGYRVASSMRCCQRHVHALLRRTTRINAVNQPEYRQNRRISTENHHAGIGDAAAQASPPLAIQPRPAPRYGASEMPGWPARLFINRQTPPPEIQQCFMLRGLDGGVRFIQPFNDARFPNVWPLPSQMAHKVMACQPEQLAQ